MQRGKQGADDSEVESAYWATKGPRFGNLIPTSGSSQVLVIQGSPLVSEVTWTNPCTHTTNKINRRRRGGGGAITKWNKLNTGNYTATENSKQDGLTHHVGQKQLSPKRHLLYDFPELKSRSLTSHAETWAPASLGTIAHRWSQKIVAL